MSVAVKAWAEHERMRAEKAQDFAAVAAVAVAEARESGNYGFLVGEIDVVRAQVVCLSWAFDLRLANFIFNNNFVKKKKSDSIIL